MASQLLPYLGTEEIADKKQLLKSVVAEVVGTMFLVLIGCGSCISKPGDDTDYVRIALAFGVTVATLAQSIGHVSGCHVNPAVTAGLLFGRKIGFIKSIIYVGAQCIGGVIGAAVLKAVTSPDLPGYEFLGLSTVNPKLSAGQAFGVEFLITFLLVLVVFAAAADEHNAASVKGSAPLAIGLSIATAHLLAIPLTGSSMNPARTFGPACITGIWDNHWVYWIGPILGGICAALLYQMVFKAEPAESAAADKSEYDEVATKEEKLAA